MAAPPHGQCSQAAAGRHPQLLVPVLSLQPCMLPAASQQQAAAQPGNIQRYRASARAACPNCLLPDGSLAMHCSGTVPHFHPNSAGAPAAGSLAPPLHVCYALFKRQQSHEAHSRVAGLSVSNSPQHSTMDSCSCRVLHRRPRQAAGLRLQRRPAGESRIAVPLATDA